MIDKAMRCGYVAIIGRPNVGKSTLLNRLVGQKLSIISPKPQTTRHRILGINTRPDAQILYVDTPGIHLGAKQAMNRYMNRVAGAAINDVDVIVFMVAGLRWSDEDQHVLDRLAEVHVPVILAVNKVDRVTDKADLLPHLHQLAGLREFADVFPLSASRGDNVEALEARIVALLPEAPPLYPEDQITDRSERFIAAELIREHLFRRLGQELPYALTVEIEQYKTEKEVLHIHAVIWVSRDSHKAIVIGQGGEGLKRVGAAARRELEQMLETKVFLQLWVKVKKGWSDDERALRSLGYTE
jgi:GTP-binding protein Era